MNPGFIQQHALSLALGVSTAIVLAFFVYRERVDAPADIVEPVVIGESKATSTLSAAEIRVVQCATCEQLSSDDSKKECRVAFSCEGLY